MAKMIADSWVVAESGNIPRVVRFYAKLGIKPSVRMPSYVELKAPGGTALGFYSLGSKMDVAAKHFDEAVKADEKSAEAHYNHALAMDGMGDHNGATQEFSRALELAPKNPAIADSPILKAHLERMKKK